MTFAAKRRIFWALSASRMHMRLRLHPIPPGEAYSTPHALQIVAPLPGTSSLLSAIGLKFHNFLLDKFLAMSIGSIIIIIIIRHAPCQCVAPLASNSLHSDLSKASSIASSLSLSLSLSVPVRGACPNRLQEVHDASWVGSVLEGKIVQR